MYKLVFLLVFSVKAVMNVIIPGSILHVTVDIDIKAELSGSSIQFSINPASTIQVSEGQEIQFHATTETTLYDFWCNNANDEIILRPTVKHVGNDGTKLKWDLGSPITYSKANIKDKLNCISQIKPPVNMKVNAPTIMGEDRQEYIQGEFVLLFRSTEPVPEKSSRQTSYHAPPPHKENLSLSPNSGSSGVSLTIPQLGNDWTWINERQSRKKYKYKFVEGETKFDCSLNNPTDNEEEFAITFYLNGNPDPESNHLSAKKLSSTTAIIQPKSNHVLTCNVTLNKYDKSILCAAVNKKASGITSLKTEIQLEYIIPPSIFLNITDETNKLTMGKYIPDKHEQEYYYEFKIGEELKINCAVNTAKGYEKYRDYYGVTLQLGSREVYKAEKESHISKTLMLENNDSVLRCKAWNRKAYDSDSLPRNLYSTVYLHSSMIGNPGIHDPPVFPIITGPTNLIKQEYVPENHTQMYSYNFTEGQEIQIHCKMEDYVLSLFVDQKGVGYNEAGSVSRTLTLKKEDKTIMCVAKRLDTRISATRPELCSIVHLHFSPTDIPELTIGGLRNLQKGEFSSDDSMQKYNYYFTDSDSINGIKVSCNVKGSKTRYDLAFYYDGNKTKQSEEVTFIEHTFFPIKDNKEISCVALDKATARSIATLVIQLHHRAPDSAQVDLSVAGLPDNSCVITAAYNIEKKCKYSYNDPALIGTKIPLNCTLAGKLTSIYTLTFGTFKRQMKNEDTQRTISNEFSLTGKNETQLCTANKSNGFNFTVFVNIYYVPPTTTEPSITAIEKLTSIPIQASSPAVQNADAVSQSDNKPNSEWWWLKFVLGAGVLFITLCVVCCFVYYRRKKPPPDDSTYANLTKDQTSYQTLPVAAPRTLKPGAKVTVEGAYSEPKDSQDMSEALYADPNRFNGSDTYAEPYVKSATKSKPCSEPIKSDYAEPYKSEGNYAEIVKPEGNYAAIGNSEGNYAEIGKNSDNKELYAKPIPKSQRGIIVKDESNYSNVFTEQYANTKK